MSNLCLLFHKAPILVLTSIDDNINTTTRISKKVDVTFPRVAIILKKFENAGLVTIKKQGRMKIIVLTQIGAELKQELLKIITILHNRQSNI